MTDLELITLAASFAAKAHGTQTRKASAQPYVTHLLRVAHEAARAKLPPGVIAAGLLHDTLEDTPSTKEDLLEVFPNRVVHLVELLTKWWPDEAPREVTATEKPKYYARILGDPDAIELKLIDRADNLRDMVAAIPVARSWAQRYLDKTDAEIAPILAKSRNLYVRELYEQSLKGLRAALKA